MKKAFALSLCVIMILTFTLVANAHKQWYNTNSNILKCGDFMDYTKRLRELIEPPLKLLTAVTGCLTSSLTIATLALLTVASSFGLLVCSVIIVSKNVNWYYNYKD